MNNFKKYLPSKKFVTILLIIIVIIILVFTVNGLFSLIFKKNNEKGQQTKLTIETPSSIAQKANLKRTTVYNILPELVADGLVSMTKHNGKKVFSIDSPSKLSSLVEERKKAVEKI